jgi:hypothetical protein
MLNRLQDTLYVTNVPCRGSSKICITILCSVLRKVHKIFQEQLSTYCELVIRLSTSSILLLPSGHRVAAYVFFILYPVTSTPPSKFPSITCCNGSYYARCAYPVSLLLPFYCLWGNPFLSSMTFRDNISDTICPANLHPSPAPHFKCF